MSRNSASVAAAAALLLVAWSAVGERSAAGETASDARPTGYVSPTEARFEIPLPPQAQWEWGSPDTPPNQLEYAWLLRIGREGDEHHGLGFMRFRHSSDQPRSGSFPDLLRAGQLDLWELQRGGADGGRLIRSVRVEGYVDGGRLIVVLRDQDAIRSIFAGRPPVTLQETVYPAAPRNTEVAVQYTGI